MKRILSLTLTLLMLLGAMHVLPVSAAYDVKTVAVDGGTLEYIENDDGSVTVNGFTDDGSTTSLTLPDEIDGKPVTALRYFTNKKITELTLPAKLETLGESSVFGCNKLRKINLGGIKKICHDAIGYCNSLEELTLPKTLKNVEPGFIYWTDKLKKFRVDGDNPYFTVKDGVLFNKKLTALYQYPGGKTNKTYKVPNSVTRIRKNAFYWNDFIEKLTLGKGVKTPETAAVALCDSFKTVDFGDGITKWDTKFVVGCQKLSKAVIGKNLSEIVPNKAFADNYEFYDCGFIREYVVRKGNKNFTAKNGVLYNKTITRLVRYAGSAKKHSFNIPDSVKIIEACAFKSAYQLQNICLGKNTEKFKYASFEGTSRLHTMDFPKGMTAIPEKCFYRGGLTSVKIPSGIKSIGYRAFCATNLEKVTFSKTVETIGEEAFFACLELNKIRIPKTVRNIGAHAIGFDDDEDYYPESEADRKAHVVPSGIEIKCFKGSAAHKYAKENGINFTLL